MAISVKEAVKAAKDALLELYEDDPPKDVALEEIEEAQEDGQDLWAVTLGFYRYYLQSRQPYRTSRLQDAVY